MDLFVSPFVIISYDGLPEVSKLFLPTVVYLTIIWIHSNWYTRKIDNNKKEVNMVSIYAIDTNICNIFRRISVRA